MGGPCPKGGKLRVASLMAMSDHLPMLQDAGLATTRKNIGLAATKKSDRSVGYMPEYEPGRQNPAKKLRARQHVLRLVANDCSC